MKPGSCEKHTWARNKEIARAQESLSWAAKNKQAEEISISEAQKLLVDKAVQAANLCMYGTSNNPADTPEARIALIVSDASRKRMAIRMAKVPKPTSSIPLIELFIRSR